MFHHLFALIARFARGGCVRSQDRTFRRTKWASYLKS